LRGGGRVANGKTYEEIGRLDQNKDNERNYKVVRQKLYGARSLSSEIKGTTGRSASGGERNGIYRGGNSC